MSKFTSPQVESTIAATGRAKAAGGRARRKKRKTRWSSTEPLDDTAPHTAQGTFDESNDEAGQVPETDTVGQRQMGTAKTLQAKLVVGSINDPLEREADEVAERVMRTEDSEPYDSAKNKTAIHSAPLDDDGGNPTVHRAPTKDDTENTPSPVAESIATLRRDGGKPLPRFVRQDFEHRFHHDFNQVRVHTGEGPATVAKQLRAKAFTLGQDVVFGQDRFQPETDSGKRLLAHELTHVVQQTTANTKLRPANRLQRAPEDITEPSPTDNSANWLSELAGTDTRSEFLTMLRLDLETMVDDKLGSYGSKHLPQHPLLNCAPPSSIEQARASANGCPTAARFRHFLLPVTRRPHRTFYVGRHLRQAP
jgi:hypothetical protein